MNNTKSKFLTLTFTLGCITLGLNASETASRVGQSPIKALGTLRQNVYGRGATYTGETPVIAETETVTTTPATTETETVMTAPEAATTTTETTVAPEAAPRGAVRSIRDLGRFMPRRAS